MINSVWRLTNYSRISSSFFFVYGDVERLGIKRTTKKIIVKIKFIVLFNEIHVLFQFVLKCAKYHFGAIFYVIQIWKGKWEEFDAVKHPLCWVLRNQDFCFARCSVPKVSWMIVQLTSGKVLLSCVQNSHPCLWVKVLNYSNLCNKKLNSSLP